MMWPLYLFLAGVVSLISGRPVAVFLVLVGFAVLCWTPVGDALFGAA